MYTVSRWAQVFGRAGCLARAVLRNSWTNCSNHFWTLQIHHFAQTFNCSSLSAHSETSILFRLYWLCPAQITFLRNISVNCASEQWFEMVWQCCAHRLSTNECNCARIFYGFRITCTMYCHLSSPPTMNFPSLLVNASNVQIDCPGG